MTIEDYVSFETAKLLKEKGFDVYGDGSYNSGIEIYKEYSPYGKLNSCATSKPSKKAYPAPTLQMAMKWLRKEHNLHCSSDYDIALGWYCQITSLKETVEYDYEEMKHYHPDKDNGFSSPEEACEAAIKYCLENLI